MEAVGDAKDSFRNTVLTEIQIAVCGETEEYNEKLRGLGAPFSEHEELSELYYSVLDVAGNGIIGYISIPKINVNLPVYHGTSDSVLNVAAGHLEGSSLPIGGESRHSVLSAHRGLPSAKLFTDLDELEVADIFTITVLNRVMTYEVDQILYALWHKQPSDVGAGTQDRQY